RGCRYGHSKADQPPDLRRLLDHADVRQPTEAVRPVESVADQELVAGAEAGEVGLQRRPPLVRLVEQGADPDAMRAALLHQVLGETQRQSRFEDIVYQQ